MPLLFWFIEICNGSLRTQFVFSKMIITIIILQKNLTREEVISVSVYVNAVNDCQVSHFSVVFLTFRSLAFFIIKAFAEPTFPIGFFRYHICSFLGSVKKLHLHAQERSFFCLAKTAKQAMLVLSSMQPDTARRKTSRSKPDGVF